MCGIVGFYGPEKSIGEKSPEFFQRLAESQYHRGPDSHGLWFADNAELFLGHNRLAIIDCTQTGHQPMVSSTGRFVITYNGEIYNYKELREDLLNCGHQFKSSSDTEVLLAAIEQWGVIETLSRCVGMFAFGLWDKVEGELLLVRDRLGIKPLYYGISNGFLCFSSELKPIQEAFSSTLSLDYEAIGLFFKHLYIPAPFSIYKEVKKVLPGNTVSFNLSKHKNLMPNVSSYWDINEIVMKARTNLFSGSRDDAVKQLELLLKDAVDKRMRADVPYGAFLSGGIDSSLVVALMQEQSSTPVNTFSIGFEDARFDESQYAAKIAQHLGTNHNTLIVENSQLLDVVPQLPSIYDEPFADASQIPTFIVSKLAREHVTVALSGDGGDELFGGYDRYAQCCSYWNKLKYMPSLLGSTIEHTLKIMQRDIKGGRLARAAKITTSTDALDFYQNKLSVWAYTKSLTRKNEIKENPCAESIKKIDSLSPVEQFMLLDAQTYLPSDILTKVDRASMANSLEVRVPILDHRVVEFAWQMPLDYKVMAGVTKFPLRKILSQKVPVDLFERPKQGFSPPLSQWLRGDLKNWAGDMIFAHSLDDKYSLDYKPVQNMWKQHQQGTHDRSYYLWPAICLSAWLDKYNVSIE